MALVFCAGALQFTLCNPLLAIMLASENKHAMIMCPSGAVELIHTAGAQRGPGGDDSDPDNEGKTVRASQPGVKYGRRGD